MCHQICDVFFFRFVYARMAKHLKLVSGVFETWFEKCTIHANLLTVQQISSQHLLSSSCWFIFYAFFRHLPCALQLSLHNSGFCHALMANLTEENKIIYFQIRHSDKWFCGRYPGFSSFFVVFFGGKRYRPVNWESAYTIYYCHPCSFKYWQMFIYLKRDT